MQGGSGRAAILAQHLGTALRVLQSLRGQEQLTVRAAGLLEQLKPDGRPLPAWMVIDWTLDQAAVVAKAAHLLTSTGKSPPKPAEVNLLVSEFLQALEDLALAHTDPQEQIAAALRAGQEPSPAVTALEYGLEVLEAVCVSSPRKERKTVRCVCERVEGVLDD
eukprot:COSAG05_NODE_6472_length_951_cov_3.996479_1_plen_162_part_01